MHLLLREHQPAVDHHLELSSRALDQPGVDATFLLDLRRQTGGSGKVVSLNAVGDLDRAHVFLPVLGCAANEFSI
jgi:hypothetical protein